MNLAKAEIEIKKTIPPFTYERALQKIRMAEDGWNGQSPNKIALACPVLAGGGL